jgi:hypothetical protein
LNKGRFCGIIIYLDSLEVLAMTEVVAALIWNNDKFMICQRPAHKARGLLWKFVGGKVESGETKEQALVCRGQGVAGCLLNMAVEDLRNKEISPVYLLTNHTGFYERYGWEFLCIAQGDGEEKPSRMYVHR